MGLNELGCIAAQCWQEIPLHYKNAVLDAWVIMPNHVHGILLLGDQSRNQHYSEFQHQADPPHCRGAINCISTGQHLYIFI